MFRYLVKNICLSLIVALVACGGSSSKKEMTTAEKSSAVNASLLVLVGLEIDTEAVGSDQTTTDCDSGNFSIDSDNSTLTYNKCLFKNTDTHTIIFDGTKTYDLTTEGTTDTVSLDSSDVSIKEVNNGTTVHDVTTNGSAKIIFNNASTSNDIKYTLGDSDNYTALLNGSKFTFTGDVTINSDTSIANGKLTVSLDSASITCTFSKFNLDKAKCADFASTCGVTTATDCIY